MTPLLDENIMKIAAFVEIALLFTAILLMIFFKLFYSYRTKMLEKRREELKDLIFQEIFEKEEPAEELTLPRRLSYWNVLLPALEKISSNLAGESWNTLLTYLVDFYLKEKARSWAYKRSWQKRNVAARIFFLAPDKKDKKEITALLHDKSFLIRSIAAHPAVRSGSPPLIEAVLQVMGREHERRRYTYRHAIESGEWTAFEIVVDIYQETEDFSVKVACLDIFGYRMTTDPHQLVKRDIQSQSPKVRLMVAKIALKFPSEDSMGLLLNYLEDPDSDVRATAARGLGIFGDASCIEKLREALNDNDWGVRVESALSLKKLGEEGIKTLQSLDSELNPEAYEAGRYALTLP